MANTRPGPNRQAPASKKERSATTQAKSSWRDVLAVHPAAELFPLMSADELKALGEDIKKNGLRSPASLQLDGDGTPVLLDGRNRLDALALLDEEITLDNSSIFDTIPSDIDPYAYVISVNIRRRHLTTAEKIKLVEDVIRLNPQMSSRRAAKLANVSPTTATKARAKLEQAGDVSTVDTSIRYQGARTTCSQTPPSHP
jgi:hypothetical protein